MDLTISLVNYNTKNLVKQFVKTVTSFPIPISYEIIITDNGSRDGSADMIEREILPRHQHVKLIAGKNVGFGAGHNRGLAGRTGNVFMIANADIVMLDDAITPLLRFLASDDQRGIAAPKLIYPDWSVQQSCHAYPRLATPLYRRTILQKTPWGGKELARYNLSDCDKTSPLKVDWVVGACLLIKKNVWDAVSGFDERYFMYCEDIDLCRKVWKAGYEVWYNPNVSMIHYHKRLSAQKKMLRSLFDKTTRIHIASHLKYIRKWR
ncbi:MAG: glycosyltransferase family 2 protein [Candidatus Jacksonbacteria bacterium]|nr:glycosyltransferase family 2 protein [Candidatus Jacksonbacteria bacterium]